MFLVSCPSQHHLRKERSFAPSKCCSLDNSRKERHGVCERHVRAILRCDSSEWRVTASGFSISRVSGRDWCALSVSICSSFSFSSCGGFLFSFCSSGGPFSLLAACTDSLRYDRCAWTVGFRNFLPDRPSNYRQTDPRIESLRKNCPIFGKAYMFKVELWSSVIFERQGLVFFVEQRDFDDPEIDNLINEEPSPISGTGRARHVGGRHRDTHTAKCEHTVKHYCFIDIDYFTRESPARASGFENEDVFGLLLKMFYLNRKSQPQTCCKAETWRVSSRQITHVLSYGIP